MAARKKFISVGIPLLSDEMEVLGTKESLDGNTIKLDMTRKMRGKGLEIVFQIFNNDSGLAAYPKKMHLMGYYIRRMMRKRSSYVEDSFKTSCNDGDVIVKPFLITRKKVSRVVRKNLRNTARDFIVNYLKDISYHEACEAIVSNALQKEMLPKLKKVYPLSFCDIRVFETSELDKIVESMPEKKEVKEEKEEEENKGDSEDKEEAEEEKTEDNEEVKEEEAEEKKEKKVKKKTKKVKKEEEKDE